MKRHITTLLGIALLCTMGASVAGAAYVYPPGPPFRSCASEPDSVSIYSIQQSDTTLAACHPATLDTVLGVRGVITGFDPRGTGYGFYIQNGIGPWTGVDIFTGSTSYLGTVPGTPTGGNLLVGDSVVVYGRTQEFPASNGMTEIEGYDGVQGTNDIIIRRIASGVTMPPIHTTNISEMTWLTAFNTGAEQWEGCLVYLPGPLKVGRIAGTGIQSPNFLLTSVTPSTDSVLVDQFTLTSITLGVPPVGTIVESVTGIVNQATSSAGSGAINSYRIQIRSGNDLVTATPPALGDAYPIEDNQLRLVFDKNVDPTTAQTVGNYSLASGIDGSTVDSAVMESTPGNVVILTITSVLTDGELETVGVAGVGSQTCPTCVISPQQTRSFVNGVLTCAEVQKPDVTRLPLFDDRSRFAGTGTLPGSKFTVRGTAVQQYGALYYIVDEDRRTRGGMSVFAPIAPLVAGNRYRIAGQVQEFDFETELVNSTLLTNEGAGTVPPPIGLTVASLIDTTTDVNQNVYTGEDYEGMLVTTGWGMVAENRTVGQSWFMAAYDPATPDTVLISNLNGVLNSVTPPDSASIVQVTGILHYANGRFRVCPRDAGDIVETNTTGVGGKVTEIAFSVSPNPARVSNVSFSLPKADLVDLGVFDVSGRKVAQLARGRLIAGTYSKEWNGVDQSGARVSPGMYFYRLRVGTETRTIRGILLQ